MNFEIPSAIWRLIKFVLGVWNVLFRCTMSGREKSSELLLPTAGNAIYQTCLATHDDVIKLKHFPRYWPFVWLIHRSPVNSPHKGQWHGALMFSLIWAWTNNWANNGDAGDLRRHRAHYDGIVMRIFPMCTCSCNDALGIILVSVPAFPDFEFQFSWRGHISNIKSVSVWIF